VNYHQLGARRDRLVLDALSEKEWGCLDTDQLHYMFFPSIRVARRRLQILVKKGKLKRTREVVETPYSYFIKKCDNERIALNWLRLWLTKRLKSWEVIDEFCYETNTCLVLNTVTNAVKTYNVFYNVYKKIWIDGEVIIVYDFEKQRQEASKRVKGTLLLLSEIKEELKCQ
jgi:hypothetical protein